MSSKELTKIFNTLHSKNECSKLTLFLFSVQLQRKMELITMMIRYIPTILMFPICLPVCFLFTQTTWFYLSCQFLSHTVNFFKFDKTGRVEGSLTGFFSNFITPRFSFNPTQWSQNHYEVVCLYIFYAPIYDLIRYCSKISVLNEIRVKSIFCEVR